MPPPPPPPPPPPELGVGAVTLMVTSCVTSSLLMPQVRLYTNEPAVVAVWVTDPEASSEPLQGTPFAPPPLAVHCVAPGADQEIVKAPPVLRLVRLLESVSESVPMVSGAVMLTGVVAGSML